MAARGRKAQAPDVLRWLRQVTHLRRLRPPALESLREARAWAQRACGNGALEEALLVLAGALRRWPGDPTLLRLQHQVLRDMGAPGELRMPALRALHAGKNLGPSEQLDLAVLEAEAGEPIVAVKLLERLDKRTRPAHPLRRAVDRACERYLEEARRRAAGEGEPARVIPLQERKRRDHGRKGPKRATEPDPSGAPPASGAGAAANEARAMVRALRAQPPPANVPPPNVRCDGLDHLRQALVTLDVAASDGRGVAVPGTGDRSTDMAAVAATLAAHRLRLASGYEELLCLEHLRGVERFDYQIETVQRVLRRFKGRALLCDEVGLGKTIEAGMLLLEYRLRGLVRSALVLVPPTLLGQWREELEEKFGIGVVTTDDELYRSDPAAFWSQQGVILASLATARRPDNAERLAGRSFDLIIVDEAHALKRASTRSHRLVDRLRSRFLLLLTATPVETDLSELYSLVNLVFPGKLETRSAFRRRFVAPGDATTPRDAEQLRQLLSEAMIRNTRALAGIHLPPREAVTFVCDPEPGEERLYRGIRKLLRTSREDGAARRLGSILLQEAGSCPLAVRETLRRTRAREKLSAAAAKQIAELTTLSEQTPTTAKLGRLLDLLASAADARRRTVVFCRFRATLSYLSRSFEAAGIPHAALHGGARRAEKAAALERFRSGAPVLLCTEVGSEGLNLQFASGVVNFDLPWNPMRIEQRIGRLHRIGQKQVVSVANLCVRGTAEERILEVLEARLNLFELVIGEVDLILGDVEDEASFEQRVVDIYAGAADDDALDEEFARLAQIIDKARQAYRRTVALDHTLFGRDLEV